MNKRIQALLLIAACLCTSSAWAQKKDAPGVTDTEIKIGNTGPYSGPVSAAGVVTKAMGAYLASVNEAGGVNHRKIDFISLDDAYSPPKTVEQTHRLVEQDGVAFMFGQIGTPTNSAVEKYLNGKGVPQLFLVSNASKWNNPREYPWSMAFPWAPSYAREAALEAAYIRRTQARRADCRDCIKMTIPAGIICTDLRRASGKTEEPR